MTKRLRIVKYFKKRSTSSTPFSKTLYIRLSYCNFCNFLISAKCICRYICNFVCHAIYFYCCRNGNARGVGIGTFCIGNSWIVCCAWYRCRLHIPQLPYLCICSYTLHVFFISHSKNTHSSHST